MCKEGPYVYRRFLVQNLAALEKKYVLDALKSILIIAPLIVERME
jgi:hypothetical protein